MRPTINDETLIEAVLGGNREAYGQLVAKYQPRLLRVVTQMVRHHAEAEDLVQEAFLQAYTHLNTFQQKSSFFTWLYRIAVNLVISQRRRKRPAVSLDALRDVAGEEPADRHELPADRLLRLERSTALRAALAKLDADHQDVLVLRAVQGFEYREIGTLLGLKMGTVRSRLHRARLSLRLSLEAAAGH
jgi:RNA polymerase sigma-70 factor (ECF subfamily)